MRQRSELRPPKRLPKMGVQARAAPLTGMAMASIWSLAQGRSRMGA